MKLANKVALVTGGARGLGRAYVLHLAKLGADVVINDVDLNAAEEYDEALNAASVAAEVEALGRRALGIQTDVTDKAAVEAMMQQTVDAFGQIDILVTNAGGMLHPPPNHTAATAPPDHYHYIMDINLTGTIFCCQAAAPYMQAARSGKIVTVASQAGLWSGRNSGGMAYKVAKAGVIHYTRVLAAELGPAQHPCQLYCAGICALLTRRRRRPQQPRSPRPPAAGYPPRPPRHARRLRQSSRIPGHRPLRLRHRPVHPRLRRLRRFLTRRGNLRLRADASQILGETTAVSIRIFAFGRRHISNMPEPAPVRGPVTKIYCFNCPRHLIRLRGETITRCPVLCHTPMSHFSRGLLGCTPLRAAT